MTALLEIYC